MRRRSSIGDGAEKVEMVKDKRLYPRSKVRWPVSMITPEGAMEGETEDMSTSGAFIRCQEPLNPTERILLSVKLPSGSPLEVSAQVVWSNIVDPSDDNNPRGRGVRFMW